MILDIHTHVVPDQFPPTPAGATRWPMMDHFEPGSARVMIAGKNFRTVSEQCWSPARRLADMDELGVDAQAISPMPELLSYWLPLQQALEISRHLNEFIARMVADHPGRFYGLGMVPLQDPEAAARELPAIKKLGLHGVELGSNILGDSLGAEKFLPFFREVAALGLSVFVHALHPTFKERLVGPPMVTGAVGFPTDTGLTVASLITGRVLEQLPGLRLAFSHGGGSFPFILPRLQHAWSGQWNDEPPGEKPGPLHDLLAEGPSTYARTMYYDSLLFDGRSITYLLEMMGSSQVVVGTDYPFVKPERPVGRTLRSIGLAPEDLEAIGWHNAARFLGLAKSAAGGAEPGPLE